MGAWRGLCWETCCFCSTHSAYPQSNQQTFTPFLTPAVQWGVSLLFPAHKPGCSTLPHFSHPPPSDLLFTQSSRLIFFFSASHTCTYCYLFWEVLWPGLALKPLACHNKLCWAVCFPSFFLSFYLPQARRELAVKPRPSSRGEAPSRWEPNPVPLVHSRSRCRG